MIAGVSVPLTACVKQTELERPPVRSQKVKLPQGTWLPGIAHAAICKALPVFLLQSVLESPLPRASNLILAEARLERPSLALRTPAKVAGRRLGEGQPLPCKLPPGFQD